MENQRQKETLLKAYPYKIELHAHTYPGSHCAEVSTETVIQTFADSGYDGIVITNHFYSKVFQEYYQAKDKKTALATYLKDYHDACEFGEKYGIRVYLGAELRWDHLNSNDYLIYGVDEADLGDIYDAIFTSPEAFVRDCKKERSFFVQAHPFRDHLTRLDPTLLDGLEAFNLHPGHNGRIAIASAYADQNHLIKTAGTDYHHEGQHNLCATRMKTLPQDSIALAEELKKGDFIIEIGQSILLP